MWNKFKSAAEDKGIWLFFAIIMAGYLCFMIWSLTGKNGAVIATVLSVMGSLFGAFVGGFCSLAGTVYAADQQLKANTKTSLAIQKRDTFYLPLYLEVSRLYQEAQTKSVEDVNLEISLCAEWENIRFAAKGLMIPNSVVVSLEELRAKTLQVRNCEETAKPKAWSDYTQQCKTAHLTLEKVVLQISQKYDLQI